MSKVSGQAYVAVMKGLMTQAASAIPGMAIYLSLLFKAMKAKGTHEGCIRQCRLYRTQLFTGAGPDLDEAGRIRLDDWELTDEAQTAVKEKLAPYDDREPQRTNGFRWIQNCVPANARL